MSDVAAEAAADKASAEADTAVWRVTDGQGADSTAAAATTGRKEASGRLDFVLQVCASRCFLASVLIRKPSLVWQTGLLYMSAIQGFIARLLFAA